ncbi:MAG TPA: hypothetical protein PLT68_05140 [Actinomycetota bacterium]|nr:hypothetical protein [Actinomycetota bacterium]
MGSRRRWSAVALVTGALLFFAASIAGFLNANVVHGQRFAANVNQMRQDDAVARAIGAEVAAAVVDANPDLVAIQPAIQSATAAVVASSAFNRVFTEAVVSFHSALTEKGSDSAVLTVADLGSSAVSLLEAVAPDLAAKIPADLDVTLARIGGQQGIAAQIIPWFQAITALALLLPVLAVGFWALGVWLAPDRRLAMLKVGWSMLAVAAGLAVILAIAWAGSRLYDPGGLQSAVLKSATDVFGRALAGRTLVIAVAGGLIVVAASAMLPQVKVYEQVAQLARRATRRPQRPAWALARGLGLIAVGVAFVVFPAIAVTVVAVAVGLGIVLIGVAELDLVAERSRARQVATETTGAWRWAWVLPVGAGVVAVGLLGLVLLPAALPQPTPVVAVDTDACNGHLELCDRRFDEIAFPASHNSMSAADEPGWFLAEQPTGLVNSLSDGIRVFLIDTWYGQATQSGAVVTAPRSLQRAQSDLTAGRAGEITPAMRRSIDRLRAEDTLGPERVYLCHTLCELGATELEPQLAGVKDWLDRHPREVVTFFIQDATTPKDTAAVFARTGLADMAYVHEPGTAWPTLREMIDSGRRVLVLMENEGGGSQYPFLQQGFELAQDTGYTYKTVADFDCAPNRGPASADLFLVNHWLSSFQTLVSGARRANAEPVLGDRVRACQAERGQIPNFVAVNWYDQGDLLAVVDELNGFGAVQQ